MPASQAGRRRFDPGLPLQTIIQHRPIKSIITNCLCGRIAALRGARNLNIFLYMLRFMRSVRLALHHAQIINQRFPKARFQLKRTSSASFLTRRRGRLRSHGRTSRLINRVVPVNAFTRQESRLRFVNRKEHFGEFFCRFFVNGSFRYSERVSNRRRGDGIFVIN